MGHRSGRVQVKEAPRTALDDDEVEHAQVLADDAAAHGLAAAFAVAPPEAPEARVAGLHQQLDAAGNQHALLHTVGDRFMAAHVCEVGTYNSHPSVSTNNQCLLICCRPAQALRLIASMLCWCAAML